MWKFIDVDGINTRYADVGEGSPIVLIHGGEIGSGTADTWDRLIPLLAPRHRVVALDRLGAGHTDNPKSDDSFRMSSVVAHVAALLAQLGIESATIVGQSRGAFVGSRLAKDYPYLVERLVIINSASISVRFPVEPVPGTLTYKTYYQDFTGDADHDARIMSVTTEHMTPEWVAARQAIADLPKTRAAQVTFRELWDDIFAEFEVLKNDVLKWFTRGGHTKPTLIIWGIGDPTTTARDGLDLFEILAPHVEQLQLHMINRSGHWPHREYPQDVAQQVEAFIAVSA